MHADEAPSLLATIARLERAHGDTRALFDALEPCVEQARTIKAAVAQSSPKVAVEVWCAIADVLFYRRALPFDVPEYAIAIACSDQAGDATLRARTRIIAGRAALEIRPPDEAAVFFNEALAIECDALTQADAIRGLGWCELARGQTGKAAELFQEAYTQHNELGYERGVADASMALATMAALSGDRAEADALCYRAQVIFIAQRDTVRLAKVGSLREMLGIADADLPRVDVVPLAELVERRQWWRGALALARGAGEQDQKRAQVLAEMAGFAWRTIASHLKGTTEEPHGWNLRDDGSIVKLVDPSGGEVISHDVAHKFASCARSRGPRAR